ncbi:putative mitochondrial protein, partial [Nicotiana attenuata]
GVFLNQRKFVLDLLKEYNCLEVSSVISPLDLNSKLKADFGELFAHPERYRSLIGKLLFLTHTRPDLCFGLQHLSQFLQAPRLPHMTGAFHMLRYLKGTIDVGLFYSNSPDCTLTAYSDSDWAACPDTRKSVSGFCVFLGDCLVAWKSKKQPVISLSSAEAEYRTLSKVVAELTWLTQLLPDLSVPVSYLVSIFCDNQAAIHIARNPVFHERTKHIEEDCHFVRKKIADGLIQLFHV